MTEKELREHNLKILKEAYEKAMAEKKRRERDEYKTPPASKRDFSDPPVFRR